MPNFVYDSTSLAFPKSDLFPIGGSDPNKHLMADNWNEACQAMFDLRGALKQGTYFGFSPQGSDPAPVGINSYLYATSTQLFFKPASGPPFAIATAGGFPPTGPAGGQLGGTYPNPDVRGIRETGGPTLLTMGVVADGLFLKRQGSTIVGAISAGGIVGGSNIGTLGIGPFHSVIGSSMSFRNIAAGPGIAVSLDGNNNIIVTASGGGGSMAIGGAVGSGTASSVLFVGAGGLLDQDPGYLEYDKTTKTLKVFDNAPAADPTVSISPDSLKIDGGTPMTGRLRMTGGQAATGVVGEGVIRYSNAAGRFEVSENNSPLQRWVYETRSVSAGAGLTGGGNLSTDRTISMPNVGPGAGTYGGEGFVVEEITLDAQGRVTALSAVTGGSGGVGMAIGNAVTGGTAKSVLFIGLTGLLDQDPGFFEYDKQTTTLKIYNSNLATDSMVLLDRTGLVQVDGGTNLNGRLRMARGQNATGVAGEGIIRYNSVANRFEISENNGSSSRWVYETRTVTGGSGLTGGGDLTTNRIITMPNVGPGAGTIGGSGLVLTSITLDVQGRVTAVGTGTPGSGGGNTFGQEFSVLGLNVDLSGNIYRNVNFLVTAPSGLDTFVDSRTVTLQAWERIGGQNFVRDWRFHVDQSIGDSSNANSYFILGSYFDEDNLWKDRYIFDDLGGFRIDGNFGDTFFQINAGDSVPVSLPGTARLVYHSGEGILQASIDGGPYLPLGGGGSGLGTAGEFLVSIIPGCAHDTADETTPKVLGGFFFNYLNYTLEGTTKSLAFRACAAISANDGTIVLRRVSTGQNVAVLTINTPTVTLTEIAVTVGAAGNQVPPSGTEFYEVRASTSIDNDLMEIMSAELRVFNTVN